MDFQLAEDVLNKLQNRELHEYRVKKDEFLTFRQVLIKREDFKHFRGIAKRGGDFVYTYLDEPRS
ncbi:hypothetical protein [Priestia taiwanensis]|uniref:Abortive phage infection protein n=1 Tax=Priestia taiwanensis TaxID=1347902 RepID=A0A917ASX8_9BACI|nr:hypothetical protein [Priestia taiwanensis]GGE70586.1 hypothetical protein GCM10007140_20620 [Priestia taiwanensis]